MQVWESLILQHLDSGIRFVMCVCFTFVCIGLCDTEVHECAVCCSAKLLARQIDRVSNTESYNGAEMDQNQMACLFHD